MAHLWKLKKKLCNKSKEPNIAKLDSNGHLITSHDKINDLYVETYKKRLENNQMKSELKEL